MNGQGMKTRLSGRGAVTVKDDIATCLKMLRARGGALDEKAANLIAAMDVAGQRQHQELQALDQRIRTLENATDAPPANADGPDETRFNLIYALEPLLGPTINNWATADLAQLLATEWSGAVHELREIVDRLNAVTYAPVSDSPILLTIAAIDEITKLRERVAQTMPATSVRSHVIKYDVSNPCTTFAVSPICDKEMEVTAVLHAPDGSYWNLNKETGTAWPRDWSGCPARSKEDGNI